MSLYDKYGGFAAISGVVQEFYAKIQEQEELDRHFQDTDMETLMQHQIAFLCKVLGGPDNYTGKTLSAAHARLAITEKDFQLIGELLKSTLLEHGFEEQDVQQVLDIVISVKSEIVARAG